ncbi:MAG: FAD-dependent oxidoreductase [Acidimicrobiales bacterium]
MSIQSSEVMAQPRVTIIADRCAGCQECVIRCPVEALRMDRVTWTAEAMDGACVGCRQCVRTCPFGAVTVEGPWMVTERVDPPVLHHEQLEGNTEETRVGFASWDEAIAEANRCLTCPDPTCVRGCPAHNDIPAFIAAIRDHDLALAHQILRRTTVLPDVCSRVCNQSAQCEGACTWSLAGAAPVAIGRLERFVADNVPVPAPSRRESDTRGEELSVAIIGSGPAGVGAAWDLVEAGATVTVYEKDSTPGGLCVWGMPDFTLPDEVARRAWKQLSEAGVDVRCNSEIHAQDLDDLLHSHDAVVVANGAGVPMRLAIPGSQLEGVIDATIFLQGAKEALDPEGDRQKFLTFLGVGEERARPAHVLVLGAGNTAMDVARTARRLGLSATCIDWLDERFALARPDELGEARLEGVNVRFQRTLVNLVGESGRVARGELAHTKQDRASRPPEVLKGDHDFLDVDLVVMAMGYRTDSAYRDVLPGTPLHTKVAPVPDRQWTASGILANPASNYANNSPVGRLAIAREAKLWASASSISERLWAVGDALTGPATVVEAMAQGRRAAAAILAGQPSRPGRTRNTLAQHPTRVLVCYSSQRGTTARVAREITTLLRDCDIEASAVSIEHVNTQQLRASDLLVVGTWVEGLVIANVHPARKMRKWLAALPPLEGLTVSTFCTFAINPKDSLREMREVIEARGGRVVHEAQFGPKDLGVDNSARRSAFANSLVKYVHSAVPEKAFR